KATNVGSADSPTSAAASNSGSSSSTPSSAASAPATAQVNYASRPFAADSPWNQPIAANATYRTSDARTSAIRNAGTFGVNTSRWTIWVWQASSSDPLVSVDV